VKDLLTWFWGQSWRRYGLAGRSRKLAGLVWLCFIVFPVIDAITERASAGDQALAIAATVAFSASYVWLVVVWTDDGRRRLQFALVGTLVALAVLLVVADRYTWGFLFSYCAACVALVVASPWGFPAVLGTSALAVICTKLAGASAGAAFGYGVSAVGVGLLLTLLRDLRVRNVELTEARAELARSAVAAERERFARDLHDLLGHSLSVIAIKAELAGRLLPERPAEAAAEVAEVEQVARQALGEVRDAVSGYRQPTLEGELAGARMALSAAGIEAEVQPVSVALDPEVEAVLAWAVREGATNVIRHSRAQRCIVKVSADPGGAAVEVIDDGPGRDSVNGHGGNGLAGLTERAEGLKGRIEAGALPSGGFRLAVSVPVSR
jgi:two-component system sensor histidine kinase DesK